MQKINFVILLFVILLLGTNKVSAVRAFPYPITITQPDGSQLTIQLHGDEFRKQVTTLDGYIIRENAQGYYAYAFRDSLNNYQPGTRIARNREFRDQEDLRILRNTPRLEEGLQDYQQPARIQQMQEAVSSNGFPRTGSPRSIVILVNFSDKSFVVDNPAQSFFNLLNQEGYSTNGGTGSAKDYFRAASYGQFNPQFDVYGPYTLPNNMAYYGANNSSGYDVRPAEMVVHACSLANNDVNFAYYDVDNDGYVDNVFIYYAGFNEAEGGGANTIWPHKWVVSRGNTVPASMDVRFDNKKVFDYACTSELRGSSGTNMCGIGTFTHEFGHVIGMPDYYHTASSKATLGYWSIMDLGAYSNLGRTPPTYSAYDRFYLGWLTPEELNEPADRALYPLSLSMNTNQETQNQSFLLSETPHNLNGGAPSPKEFYIMEYRKKTGWDTYLPAEGLLFWHIDYDQTAWDNNTPNNYTNSTQTASSHMRVYLQPLQGYTTTPGTAFTSGSFTPLTWSGTNINREITEITKTNDSISFKIMGGAPPIVTPDSLLPVISAGVIEGLLTFPVTAISKQKVKYLNVKTTDVSGDLTVTITGENATSFSATPSLLNRVQVNMESGTQLTITYSPESIGNHTALVTISGGGLNPAKVIELRGTASE